MNLCITLAISPPLLPWMLEGCLKEWKGQNESSVLPEDVNTEKIHHRPVFYQRGVAVVSKEWDDN